ncbi:hypothetical protein C8E97_2966 [Saccharothrix australiensis]|uniref:Uncharacterized protein n=1 Tax=Saccharothrix australiensis TaxID=2072 RepID=A0A495VYE7_9PSEU|nr:hypothetical protein C8E97_2966 [Saccharothrix australiensis]
MRAGLDDSGPVDERRGDVVRRLVVAGMVGYLAQPGPPPDESVPEHVLLDLVVCSLWPVVTARKLPPDWPGELARITSPRLAALVRRARDERQPAEVFARSVADKSFSSAMVALFDDLADPRRGGALLAAMALAGGLATPPTGKQRGREVAAWALAIAGGAALAAALRHRESRVARVIGEAVTDLPADPIDPADLAALLEWLLG